jgi:hypothetical protein
VKLIVGKKFTYIVGTISIGFFLIKAYFAAGIKGSLAAAAILALLFLTAYAAGRNRAGRPLIGPKAARAINMYWWGSVIVGMAGLLITLILIRI